jgi:uncharacterized protein YndB with AHSA1/START domain
VTAPATVFKLLTDAEQMSKWLAHDVKAEPRPGGSFRLADPSGLWVEGTYIEVIRDRVVAFTWGGIEGRFSEGLKIGQSIARFNLDFNGQGVTAELWHSRLGAAAN